MQHWNWYWHMSAVKSSSSKQSPELLRLTSAILGRQLFRRCLDFKHLMTRETYKQAYATAKADLLQHLRKRDDLDQKIRKLKQTVKALGEMCGAPSEEIDKLLLVEGFAIDAKPGFTESIRRLFRVHQTALSPTEIREDLVKMGIGVGQVNLLSSIHTVLRRMVEAGEIEKTESGAFQLPN